MKNATTIQDAQYIYVLWNDSPDPSVTYYKVLLMPEKKPRRHAEE